MLETVASLQSFKAPCINQAIMGRSAGSEIVLLPALSLLPATHFVDVVLGQDTGYMEIITAADDERDAAVVLGELLLSCEGIESSGIETQRPIRIVTSVSLQGKIEVSVSLLPDSSKQIGSLVIEANV